MRPTVPLLLSINGGYVDTAGFIALQGLFTAHVTGNFVTAAAALVFGTSGVEAKLLALPVFCIVIALARVLGRAMADCPAARVRTLVGMQFLLLLAGCILAVRLGPFPNGDAPQAIITGMVLVCAMAIQNAVHRVHLASFPPTTLMTGNTTQLVLDAVDLLLIRSDQAERATVRHRLLRMAQSIVCFAAGCAAAALLFWASGMWCFAAPPLLVGMALVVLARWESPVHNGTAADRH